MSFPTVGIIGAGQLARMMAPPAIALGVKLKVLATSMDESAAQVIPWVTIGDYRNLATVREFAKDCEVITFDHEHVPTGLIRTLEAEGVRIRPSADALIHAQDKSYLREALAPYLSPRWAIANSAKDVHDFGTPMIVKAIRGGYDGRGVWHCTTNDEAAQVVAQLGSALLEEVVAFDCEVAVLVARSPHGQAAVWAVTETVQKAGMCNETIAPAPNLTSELCGRAQQIALEIAGLVNLVGVMAVEMFVIGDRVLVNELAMRPHNSGHWTIDGSVTSQFEQHLRAILDLPLGATDLLAPFAVMANIVGTEKSDLYRPYLHVFARDPGVKVHQYRKSVTPGRKLGHVTVIGSNASDLRQRAAHAADYISGVIDE
jgi:5-(carboxyamino)imidazole ribonucleotide synthase